MLNNMKYIKTTLKDIFIVILTLFIPFLVAFTFEQAPTFFDGFGLFILVSLVYALLFKPFKAILMFVPSFEIGLAILVALGHLSLLLLIFSMLVLTLEIYIVSFFAVKNRIFSGLILSTFIISVIVFVLTYIVYYEDLGYLGIFVFFDFIWIIFTYLIFEEIQILKTNILVINIFAVLLSLFGFFWFYLALTAFVNLYSFFLGLSLFFIGFVIVSKHSIRPKISKPNIILGKTAILSVIIIALLAISLVSSTTIYSTTTLHRPKIVIYIDIDESQYQGLFTDPNSAMYLTPAIHKISNMGVLIIPPYYHSDYGYSDQDGYMMETGAPTLVPQYPALIRAPTIFESASLHGWHVLLATNWYAGELEFLHRYNSKYPFMYINENANKRFGGVNSTITVAETFISKYSGNDVFISLWWFTLDDSGPNKTTAPEEYGTHAPSWIYGVILQDRAISHLVSFLKLNDYLNSTLFVFTSDEATNDGPYVTQYGPLTRNYVYLVISGPGVAVNSSTWLWVGHENTVSTIEYLMNIPQTFPIWANPIIPVLQVSPFVSLLYYLSYLSAFTLFLLTSFLVYIEFRKAIKRQKF